MVVDYATNGGGSCKVLLQVPPFNNVRNCYLVERSRSTYCNPIGQVHVCMSLNMRNRITNSSPYIRINYRGCHMEKVFRVCFSFFRAKTSRFSHEILSCYSARYLYCCCWDVFLVLAAVHEMCIYCIG